MTLFLPSLLALLATTPTADAADFTGRIRRIRIRENNSGTNYRTIVSTESTDPTDPGSLTVGMTGLETGETSEGAGRVKNTRVLASASLSWGDGPRPIETIYTMTAQLRGIEDPTLTTTWSVEVERCERECEWAEEVLDDGSVVRLRLTTTVADDGSETMTADLRLVPGDTVAWTYGGLQLASTDSDGDGEADVTIEGDLGDGPVYRTRWSSGAWSTTDDAVQLDVVLTNPDGSTDALSDFAVLDLGGETGLVEATVKPRRRGGYRADFWTQATADAPVGSVAAIISDADSDEPLAELELDAPVETTAILVAQLPSTLGEGERVAAAITLYAGDEALLSEDLSFSLAEGTLDASFSEDAGLALNKAGIYKTEDGGYELAFSVTGADAEVVSLAYVELSARTTSGGVDAEVETLWQRWAGGFDPGSEPESFGFDAEVRDGDGGVLDGWVFDIQAQLGSGTRGTAVRANSRTELL